MKTELYILSDIFNWSKDFLIRKGIEEATYKLELLLSSVLNLSRFELYLNFDRPLSVKERADFKKYLMRLANNEPVQYILGEWDFYGYNFKLNENVLIPRRETEESVERILKFLLYREFNNEKLSIADIGTGSGAIIIALYNELKKNLGIENFKKINFMATDISEKALEVASLNAEINDARDISFINCDLLSDIKENINLLVSNPPYVSLSDYKHLKKELFFEPKIAITDGYDGLSFYYRLIKEIKDRNIEKSFLEVGYNQKEDLELLCYNENIKNFKFHKDLSGNYRILEITRN